MISRSPAFLSVLGAVAISAPGLAVAYPAPLAMGPLYEEPAPPKGAAAAAPARASGPACTVDIVELTDARRAPETVGMLGLYRAVAAPADRQAWLRSVVQVGLTARGFTPVFGPPAPSDAPGVVNARISLRAVWIMTPTLNKSASVVLRMAAGHGDAGLARDYRGDTTSLFWSASAGEFNGALNKTFAEALDAMAADLRPLCAAPVPAASGG